MHSALLKEILAKDSTTAAPLLLGWKLVHETPGGRLAGYIVETEAYHEDDPASHTFNGKTKRNAAMYEAGGTVYVYFTYGMHHCVNIVTGPRGRGEGVLIRALEPTEGIHSMKHNRGMNTDSQLTNGPAKLVQALGIHAGYNGSVLGAGLHLEPGIQPQEIVQTRRIGIARAQDEPLRFYIADNPFVSRIARSAG